MTVIFNLKMAAIYAREKMATKFWFSYRYKVSKKHSKGIILSTQHHTLWLIRWDSNIFTTLCTISVIIQWGFSATCCQISSNRNIFVLYLVPSFLTGLLITDATCLRDIISDRRIELQVMFPFYFTIGDTRIYKLYNHNIIQENALL